MDRREFLKLCGSILAVTGLAGCTGSRAPAQLSQNTDADLMSGGPFTHEQGRVVGRFTPSTTPQTHRNGVQLPKKHSTQTITPNNVIAYSRSKWHARGIIKSRLRPMNGVNRITVHHEGNPKPNYACAPADVEKSILQIQRAHFKILGAGDIAYHYIIDRGGRIWQGRDIKYQGAHAKNNNSHNIGVMCLGNFNIQQPSNEQIETLEHLCKGLLSGYNIPASHLYGHKELRNTACPGKNLFPYVKRIRTICA